MTTEPQGSLGESVRAGSAKITDPAGREVRVLDDDAAVRVAGEWACGVHDVYGEALTLGICPLRYIRNREALGLEDQRALARARVAVVGAGGLGGQVILILARLGVGHLVVVDHDVFDETNLNRQVLSSTGALGRAKAPEARDLVAAFNPGVEVTAHRARLDAGNGAQLLEGSQVVVDALDSVSDRLVLEAVTMDLGVPLVHGALAGFEGQVMTIFPGDAGLTQLYGGGAGGTNRAERPEAVLGVPGITPSFISTLQAMEVLKIILGRGTLFRHTLVHVDLETGDFDRFSLERRP